MDQEISLPSIPNLTGMSRVGLGTKLPCCVVSSEPQFKCFFTGQVHHNLRLDLASFNLYSVDNMVTPTAARMMQATRARMFRPTGTQQWG
jgi:hypothetical protein